jgi:hypothetical protein
VVDIVPGSELEQANGGSGNLSAVITGASRSPEAAPELSKEAWRIRELNPGLLRIAKAVKGCASLWFSVVRFARHKGRELHKGPAVH